MPKFEYFPPSIENEGGISAWLNQNAHKHNGNDAAALKKMWNWGRDRHLSVASLAFLYNVTWQTMDKWITLLHKEAGIERKRPNK